MTTLFYCFSNFFHIYAMYMFSNVFFYKGKTNKALELFAYILYYVINSVLFLTYHKTYITLISNIVPMFSITFLYKSSVLKKITSTLVECTIFMIIDVVVFTVYNLLKTESIFFSQGFVSNIILIASAQYIAVFMSSKKEKHIALPPMYYLTISLVPFISIVLGYYVSSSLSIVSLILSVFLLLINLDIFYLYESLVDMFSEKNEQELIKSQNEAYLNELKLMQQSQMTVRCLKHDMDNHILKMQSLLDSGDYNELSEYLAQTKEYVNVNGKLITSGNEVVDSILNYKLMQADLTEVETKFNVTLPEHIKINTFDINIVIGNLIDNALEALQLAGNMDNKKLSIDIIYQMGYIKILIANTFDGVICESGKSRKGDNINHGLGLKSVNMIVEKYSGFFKKEASGNRFEASAIMYEK